MIGSITLQNGVQIPEIGFGTWRSPEGDITINAVKCALSNGYTHVDTAAFYKNEKSIGIAIQELGIPRKQLFLTSKVWNTERGYDKTMAAFEQSIKNLQTDYLDLYLIHWPARGEEGIQENLDTWRALEDLYAQGKVRAIGLSNFLEHHIQPLLDHARVKPMVDQIESHPGYTQAETIAFCQKNGILVEAWGPMGKGEVLTQTDLVAIAKRHGKSVPHVCIRWCMQHGVIPLPKSVTPERIIDNIKVYDFELSAEDMAIIDRIPRCGGSCKHPDEIDF